MIAHRMESHSSQILLAKLIEAVGSVADAAGEVSSSIADALACIADFSEYNIQEKNKELGTYFGTIAANTATFYDATYHIPIDLRCVNTPISAEELFKKEYVVDIDTFKDWCLDDDEVNKAWEELMFGET